MGAYHLNVLVEQEHSVLEPVRVHAFGEKREAAMTYFGLYRHAKDDEWVGLTSWGPPSQRCRP